MRIPSVVPERTAFDDIREQRTNQLLLSKNPDETLKPFPKLIKKAQLTRIAKTPLDFDLHLSKEYLEKETRGIEKYLVSLLKLAVYFQVKQNRKTLSQEHVVLALRFKGYDIHIPPHSKDVQRQKSIKEKQLKEEFNKVFGETPKRRSSSSSKKIVRRRVTKSSAAVVGRRRTTGKPRPRLSKR